MSMSTLLRAAARVRQQARRRMGDPGVFGVLVGLECGVAVAALIWPGEARPAVVLATPLLFGGLLLRRRRQMRLLIVIALVLLGIDLLGSPPELQATSIGSAINLAVVIAVSYELVRRRDVLGVRESRPDTILAELRERLQVQGQIPPLPAGWHVERELRSARDVGLAGDFVASRVYRDPGGDKHLDLVVVDVSGKGVSAGTRALLLSGALGGMLGSVPADRFLAEANRYLLEQHWAEGFATAIYLRVNLDTGTYRVQSAGHPPMAHFDSGSGRWVMSRTRGPVLGVLQQVHYAPDVGTVRHGDALLLYTDGVVEERDRDVEVGLDRLLGAAERLVPRGHFRGGAAYLVDTVPTRADDDRAIVMLWREP
jgi:Stage II sporulation protein E (SpoIIE)